MKFPHWQHFLSLEKDFIKTIEYVELSDINSQSHSIVYAKLLLAICSEIDIVAKQLCPDNASNIDGYRATIKGHYRDFHTVECTIPRYGLKISPWSRWAGESNPEWWTAYNKVKYLRCEHFTQANQKNVIEALAGLFTILLCLYRKEFYFGELFPLPNLLDHEGIPSILTVSPRA